VHTDYCPIDSVPNIDFSRFGDKQIRIGRNLYANNKGFIVRHYSNKEIITRMFKDRDTVIEAYSLDK